jgi:hypothetical protein
MAGLKPQRCRYATTKPAPMGMMHLQAGHVWLHTSLCERMGGGNRWHGFLM